MEGKKTKELHPLRYGILSILFATPATVVLFLALTTFFRLAVTHGYSMQPTLTEGDCSIAYVYNYTPARGDVVIIKDRNVENKYIVKRIIGLPGDFIDIDFETGDVFRNGRVLEEPYLNEANTTAGDITFPIMVQEKHVFVMGDNRSHSTDSRTSYTGMIAEENIKGRVIFRIYPLKKFGAVQ